MCIRDRYFENVIFIGIDSFNYRSVSYTHLDVYKRQIISVAISDDKAVAVNIPPKSIPVSDRMIGLTIKI